MSQEPKARARTSDPHTSHAAAATVNVNKGQAAVLRAFLAHGAMTQNQVIAACPELSDSGARTRVSELNVAGLVRYTGRDVRLGSGRWAMVFDLTYGREFYEDLLRVEFAGTCAEVDPEEAAEVAAASEGDYCEVCEDHRPGTHPDHLYQRHSCTGGPVPCDIPAHKVSR